jgi:hypothetical protein
MKTISVSICKTKGRLKLPPPPKITGRERPMSGRALINWLKAQGAKRMDAETKRRLKASGNWGMPDE